jgi:dihydropteroate synthase
LKRTLNCNGKLIDLSQPKVMGILNFTPDSFYSDSRIKTDSNLLHKVESMLLDGATFIDIGAYSSRPGAEYVSDIEETERLLPALEIILKEFPETLISVDTFRSEIAEKAIDLGAALINDISGGNLDNKMFNLVAKKQVPYILMHMRGTPQTMSSLNVYEDLILDVITELQQKVKVLQEKGLNDIVIDPGLGFAKDLNQSYKIVKHLKSFEILGQPLLIGASRKSMIYKALECEADKALNGTTVVHTASLLNGASILRVHDIKPAMDAIKITNLLKN